MDYWKAIEFRTFLLYIGPLALRYIEKRYYNHFMLLHSAIRILASPIVCHSHNSTAKTLLITFVNQYKELYGYEYISHNVHNLIHLPDDVKNLGYLDEFSAFMYENYMHTLKITLKVSRIPLQQIVKQILEQRIIYRDLQKLKVILY